MTTKAARRAAEHLLIDVVVDGHKRVEHMLAELESAACRGPRRWSLVAETRAALPRVAADERRTLHPLARRALYDGEEVLARWAAGCAAVQQMVDQLRDVEPTSPAFEPLLRRLSTTSRRHIREARLWMLPRLRDALGGAAARPLGGRNGRPGRRP